MIGTVAFMPPEIALGHEVTPAADIYSLGATLYTALEGRTPFQLDGERQNTATMLLRLISESPPQPTHAGSLAPLIMTMLSREPAQRPPTHHVLDALNDIIRQPASSSPISLSLGQSPSIETSASNSSANDSSSTDPLLLTVDESVPKTRVRASLPDAPTQIRPETSAQPPSSDPTRLQMAAPRASNEVRDTPTSPDSAAPADRPRRRRRWKVLTTALIVAVIALIGDHFAIQKTQGSGPKEPAPSSVARSSPVDVPAPSIGTFAAGTALIPDPAGDGLGHADITQVRAQANGTALDIAVSLAAPNETSDVWVFLQELSRSTSSTCPHVAVHFTPAGHTAELATMDCSGPDRKVASVQRLASTGTATKYQVLLTTKQWPLPEKSQIQIRAQTITANTQQSDFAPNDLTYVKLT